MSNEQYIAVVSGLPRSGTSVMMQMLEAGGMPLLIDGQRTPDVDNPRGYFELEAVKGIAKDKTFLDGAAGKAVKMVYSLLPHLPLDRAYRVIFMRRDLDEVIASQRKMLDRHGREGAAVAPAQLKTVYANQVQQVLRRLADHGDRVRVLEVDYASLIAEPKATANAINSFLGGSLHEDAMAAVIDASLYRNRR
jgi:hypothetical protein